MNIKKFFKFLCLIFLQLFLSSMISGILYYGFKIDIFSFSTKKIILFSFCTDILLMILLILIYRKTLVNDIKDYFKNFKSYFSIAIKYWVIGLFIMLVSNLLISILFKNINPVQNEENIQSILKVAPLYILFSCGIYAPIVEELIYRKSIKDIFNNKWVFIIVSGLLFGLMHTATGLLTNQEYDFMQLIYTFPYAVMGCIFAYIYSKTDNIFVSVTAHLTHNLVTYIISVLPLFIVGVR